MAKKATTKKSPKKLTRASSERGWFLLAVGTIVILVALIASLHFGQANNVAIADDTSDQSELINNKWAIPASDYVSWQTYQSLSGKYSFKHPVGWSVEDDANHGRTIHSQSPSEFVFYDENGDNIRLIAIPKVHPLEFYARNGMYEPTDFAASRQIVTKDTLVVDGKTTDFAQLHSKYETSLYYAIDDGDQVLIASMSPLTSYSSGTNVTVSDHTAQVKDFYRLVKSIHFN